MKRYFILAFLLIGMGLNVLSQEIDKLLNELPDVIFEQIESTEGFQATYKLMVKQPIDHDDVSKGYFYQKVYLSHKGLDRPTVIVTEGYSRTKNRVYELTSLLDANQLDVEHRYFGESMPDPLDYEHLNMKQVTADLHHIQTIFKAIYSGKWISTGISKGGSTTIFYRYFYPNDVDVSVPYVAPINNDFEDKRIYTFLDTIGTADCRKKIKDVQVRLLENREKVLPLLKFYSLGANATYDYLGFEEAFELTVLEYPFSFWQYGQSCEKIPGPNATIEELTEYLLAVSTITFFADSDIEAYGSHYYQAATEMGYYGYEIEPFRSLVKALPTTSNPHATFMPNKMHAAFDGKLLNDVNAWLKTDANKFIYIYGGIDTWSATGVPPNKDVDAIWFYMKGKHHGNARIKEMTAVEKDKLVRTLEKWLSMKID